MGSAVCSNPRPTIRASLTTSRNSTPIRLAWAVQLPPIAEPHWLLAENRVIRGSHRIVALTYIIGGANRFGPRFLPLDGQVPL